MQNEIVRDSRYEHVSAYKDFAPLNPSEIEEGRGVNGDWWVKFVLETRIYGMTWYSTIRHNMKDLKEDPTIEPDSWSFLVHQLDNILEEDGIGKR